MAQSLPEECEGAKPKFLGPPLRPRLLQPDAGDGFVLGAAAAELAGDGGFHLPETGLQAGLERGVERGPVVDRLARVDQGAGDRSVMRGQVVFKMEIGLAPLTGGSLCPRVWV